MQSWRILISGIALSTIFASASAQIHKEWALDRRVAQDLDAADGRITDAPIVAYWQQIADRIANAGGGAPLEVRLTPSSDQYARLMPGRRTLYLSAGLLEDVESEGELAGLFAHELAHTKQSATRRSPNPAITVYFDSCILAAQLFPLSRSGELRAGELQASTTAIAYLRTAGYDPANVLDLFSKLAYRHPIWAKVIAPEDLQRLRGELEAADNLPPEGYRIDSSQFSQARNKLAAVARRNRK